jgi:hypothetical protein
VLQAYGHASATALSLGLHEVPDDDLLRDAKRLGFDLVLSLDNHRQPEVWSRTLLSLAEGAGRLIRVKLPKTEIPDVPALTQRWAAAYREIQPHLDNRRSVLIQLGNGVNSNRPAPRGFEIYTKKDVAQMVQQEMSLHSGRLLVPGSPRPRR